MRDEPARILDWVSADVKRPGLSRDLPPGSGQMGLGREFLDPCLRRAGRRSRRYVPHRRAIADVAWIGWSLAGANLTTIYVTHGHGDHFFGLAPLLDRFPRAKAVAFAEVVEAMQHATCAGHARRFLAQRFPDRSPSIWSWPSLSPATLALEGHELVRRQHGHEPTRSTRPACHVPSIGLIVAGDIVYNGIHPFSAKPIRRAGSNGSPRSTGSKLSSRSAVVAGHKMPENDDDPSHHRRDTRQYLRDFNRLDEETGSARELYDAMLKLSSRPGQSGLAVGRGKRRQERAHRRPFPFGDSVAGARR